MLADYVVKNNAYVESKIHSDDMYDFILDQADEVIDYGKTGGFVDNFGMALVLKKHNLLENENVVKFINFCVNELVLIYIIPSILSVYEKYKTIAQMGDNFILKSLDLDEYKFIGDLINRPYIDKKSLADMYRQNIMLGLLESQPYKEGLFNTEFIHDLNRALFGKIKKMQLEDLVSMYPLPYFEKKLNIIRSRQFHVYAKEIYNFLNKLKDKLDKTSFDIVLMVGKRESYSFKFDKMTNDIWKTFVFALKSLLEYSTVIRMSIYVEKAMTFNDKVYEGMLYDVFELDYLKDKVVRYFSDDEEEMFSLMPNVYESDDGRTNFLKIKRFELLNI